MMLSTRQCWAVVAAKGITVKSDGDGDGTLKAVTSVHVEPSVLDWSWALVKRPPNVRILTAVIFFGDCKLNTSLQGGALLQCLHRFGFRPLCTA